MLGKKSAPVLGGTVTVTAETMAGIQRLKMCESFQCGFKIPVRIGSAIVAIFFF